MNWFLCRNCSTLVVIGSDLKSWLKVTVIWGSSLCLQTSACFLFRISFSSLAFAFTSFCASIQGESTTCMCFNNKQCVCPRRGFLWKAYWDWKYLFSSQLHLFLPVKLLMWYLLTPLSAALLESWLMHISILLWNEVFSGMLQHCTYSCMDNFNTDASWPTEQSAYLKNLPRNSLVEYGFILCMGDLGDNTELPCVNGKTQ